MAKASLFRLCEVPRMARPGSPPGRLRLLPMRPRPRCGTAPRVAYTTLRSFNVQAPRWQSKTRSPALWRSAEAPGAQDRIEPGGRERPSGMLAALRTPSPCRTLIIGAAIV
jgi:hypothetical protein